MKPLHRSRPPGLLLVSLLGLPLTQLACGSDFGVSQVVARLAADPGFVDFGTVAVGAELDQALQLTVDQGQVEILAMELVNVEGDFLEVDNSALGTIDAGAVRPVAIAYRPGTAGFHWGELHIVTNEGDGAEHVLQVRGEARDNIVRAWPASVDFGPVQVGATGSASVFLANEGQLDVTVTGLSIAEPVFGAVTAAPIDLPAGARAEIELSFTPTNENAARGELVVSFDQHTVFSPISLRGNDCSAAAGDLYDQDGDGFGYCGGDCDDWDEDVHPGATETCDGFDQDCDGLLDEGTTCSDDDGDGYSEYDGDCNDGDAQVGQHMDEIPDNGVDDDCDGTADDGVVDRDGDGYAEDGGDCDDTDASIYPGANEQPDGDDDDCDGTIDEGTELYDDDGDGFSEVVGDCDDSDPAIRPGATETANWLDDDCDGRVDEGTSYGDDDRDGFSELGGDCDDADASVSPGVPEIVGDGVDNDCDGDAE